MTWHNSKRIARRSLKWLNWTLLLPSLLLMLLLAALLFTAPGLHLTLWLAETAVPGLHIARSDGSVLGGHRLYQIRYQQPGINLNVQQSELIFNNGCLFNLSACVEKLALQGLTLQLTPTDTAADAASDSTAMTAFWLPFPLTITQLAVNNAQLDIQGTQLNWHSFSSGIDVWGNKVQLIQPHWQQVTLTPAVTADSKSSRQPFAYQPPALTDFSLPLSLFIDRFRLTDFTLRQQDEVQKITELQLSLQWQDQQLELLQLDVNHPQVTLHGSGKVFTEQHYALQANLNVQLTQGEFSNQQLQLDASGDLSRLHLQARATGAVNATLGATLDLLQAQLPHRLELHSEQLQWPLSAATPQFTLSRSTLLLQGELQHSQFSGQLSINGAAVPAAAAEFSGYSSLSGLTLEKLLVNTLGGQINLNASLDWQQGLNWQGQTKLDDIQPGLFWPDYDGKLNGTLQHRGAIAPDNSWQLAIPQMALSGTLRNYALTLNGSLNAADNSGQGDYQLHTPGLTLNHADNTISVQGSVQQDWNLSVTAAIPALAQSVSGAQGSLNGQFQITGPRLQPEIDGDISAAELRWQDFSLAQLSVSSAISLGSAQHFNSKISLEATDARYQQHKVQRISLDLDGTELKHQLNFVLNSSGHQAKLQLTGGLSENRQHWQGLLQDAEISSLPGSWQLEHAAGIKFELPQQRLTLAAHCWQQQDSSICLSKPLSASSKNVAASVDINQFNLTSLAALIPNQFALTGKIDATLDANWQQGKAPTATLAISSVNGQMTQQLDTPLVLAWQKLMLSSELADDTLRSTLQLNIADSSALNAELQIAQLQSGARQLQGQIKLQQFALSVLQPLLGEFSELTGLVSSDLSIAGTLDAPLLNGELALTQGRIKGKQAPADIDNADVTLLFSGQQASLTGLISTAKGEITVSGDASWQQATDWQAAVNIKGDALRLQVPQARLLIAPDLTLHATPELTRLSGTVTIPSANISIDSLPQNAIELSDDLVLLDKELQPIPQQQKSTFIFQTDIKVVLGNRVKLSAFGLKTLLNGNLRVRQQPKKPLLINGDVNLQDGTFRAYGQDLLIRKGKMSFNGPADQPFLNIEAIRNPDNMEDDVIAGIRVNGPADEPSVVIFSEPAKAQANALAYLIMGRDLDGGAGNTGNAVTTSLIGMTLASSSKAVGEIGEAFGLQDLTLDTAGAGDNSQVTVSGYLSRDLQLKYGYGIFNAVGEFTLRYRLMKRLYLEAVSGLDNAVDLLYKFEFD